MAQGSFPDLGQQPTRNHPNQINALGQVGIEAKWQHGAVIISFQNRATVPQDALVVAMRWILTLVSDSGRDGELVPFHLQALAVAEHGHFQGDRAVPCN